MKLAPLLLVATLSTGAVANDVDRMMLSTNDLMRLGCELVDDKNRSCFLFFLGAIDGARWANPDVSVALEKAGPFTAAQTAIAEKPVLGCPSGPITRGQMVAIIRSFLREHPEIWHMPAAPAAAIALQRAFPCP